MRAFFAGAKARREFSRRGRVDTCTEEPLSFVHGGLWATTSKKRSCLGVRTTRNSMLYCIRLYCIRQACHIQHNRGVRRSSPKHNSPRSGA